MSIYLAKLANKVSNHVADRDHGVHPTRHGSLHPQRSRQGPQVCPQCSGKAAAGREALTPQARSGQLIKGMAPSQGSRLDNYGLVVSSYIFLVK